MSSLSKLEEIMLSNSPVQENILRYLTFRDFQRLQEAGVQIPLSEKLQNEYLFGYCEHESDSEHFVNNTQAFNDGNTIVYCSNPTPKHHGPFDRYACLDHIYARSFNRVKYENSILLDARRYFCCECTIIVLQDRDHYSCNCFPQDAEWECERCWSQKMEKAIKKITEEYPTERECATEGCDRIPTTSVRNPISFLRGNREDIYRVAACKCILCSGIDVIIP